MIFEKRDERIEIRISKKCKLLLDTTAANAGYTTSAYLRMLVNSAILPLQEKIQKGVLTYADCETILDNQLQYRKLFKS